MGGQHAFFWISSIYIDGYDSSSTTALVASAPENQFRAYRWNGTAFTRGRVSVAIEVQSS